MNSPSLERFVNAIASDLEEGGFREVTGTTLRRNLTTAVQAALPLLSAQAGGAALSAQPSPGGQGDAVRALSAEWRARAEELSVHDAVGLTHQLKLKDCADELDAALASMPPSPAMGVTDAMVHAYSQAYDKNWEAQLRAPEDAPELGTFFAMRAGLQAALAARQPVGEPFAYTRATTFVDPLPVITTAEYAGLRAQGLGELYRALGFEDAPPPAQAIFLERYDAGLLSDVGGGDTAWWLNYLRSELGRAHDHYQHQVNPAKEASHG